LGIIRNDGWYLRDLSRILPVCEKAVTH
jgi:hypothetical protein